jgi:O-antigen/teichoic acid export membrane protein
MTAQISHRLALVWAFAQAWVGKGASALVYIALGYLLPPEEFGAYAVAATFLVLAEMFVEQAIAQTVIQLPSEEPKTAQDLQTVAFILGALCSVGCLLLALVSHWQRPGSPISAYSAALTICPMFIGLNAVPIGMLRKGLNYKLLTQRTAWATGIGGVLGVIAANFGGNGWALVVMATIYQLVSWVLLKKHRPPLNTKLSVADVRHIKHLLLINSYPKVADFIESKGMELMAAHFLGLQIAGALAYATKIVQTVFTFLIAPTIDTAWGQFGRLRAQPETLEKSYRNMCMMLTLLGLPAFCMLTAASYELMPHLLGERWTLLHDLLPLLCLSLLTRGPLYLASVMVQVIHPSTRISTIALTRAALAIGVSGLLMVFHGGNFTAVAGFCLAGLLVVYPTMRCMTPISAPAAASLRSETVFLTLTFTLVWALHLWALRQTSDHHGVIFQILLLTICAGVSIALAGIRHLKFLRQSLSRS